MSGNTQEHISINQMPSENLSSKSSIRETVWRDFRNQRQWVFPLPFGRIPNFKGAREAAEKLLSLAEFRSAQSVEVNPDKPLEPCRMLVLKQNKKLYVPIPQLHGSLLKKIEINEKYNLQKTVSIWGIKQLGNEINLDDQIHIDLLIVGSVAVSKIGQRIGKGRGYADLEFALLKEMKAINDNTVIITVVHDLQIFDMLPNNLFEIYDVPIDIIVTPTQIIRVEKKLPRPEGLYWNKLTPKRVQSIEILKKLKDKHESEGKDVTLSASLASDSNTPRPFRGKRFNRIWRRKPQQKHSADIAGTITNGEQVPPNTQINEGENSSKVGQVTAPENKEKGLQMRTGNAQNRVFPKGRWRNRRNAEENQQKEKENNENQPPKMKKRKRTHERYSLCVSNIEKSVRVRDLKSALTEKGIRPNFIVWNGTRGFCYLHYTTKKKNPENQEAFAIDNIIEKIQGIRINPTQDQGFEVKVMDPITRIETVNVTSV